MEYEQALKATITFTDAKQEIKKHGYCFNEFLQDVGKRDEYTGATVLNWLGY